MKEMLITGHVGKNPQSNTDKTGNKYVNFSVGVNVGVKEKPKTDWIQITCVGNLADIAIDHVKQGALILVKGFPGVHAYKNDKDEIIAIQKLTARHIEFLSKKDSNDRHDLSTEPNVDSNNIVPDIDPAN